MTNQLDIVFAETIDDGLLKHGDNYDHILFVAAGVRLYDSDIINDVVQEIRSKPDYLAMAHMLDWTWQDRWWELHEQFVLINAKTWRDIKRPYFGGWKNGEKDLPIIERSKENYHDNYVPLWAKDSGERKVQKYACPGSNFLNEGYKNGCNFYTWPKTIRNKHTYYYPETNSELMWSTLQTKTINQINYNTLNYNQKRFVGELLKGVQDQVWATNSEDMQLYNRGELFETVILPASGFKFLDVYKSRVLNTNGKIIMYDWNGKSLNWIKHIYTSKATEIEDLINSYSDWKDLIWFGIDNKQIIVDGKLNPSFVASFESTLSFFGGPDLFWNYVKQFRESDIKFIEADIIYESDKLYKYFNGRTLFHISNIFATDWLVGYHGLPKTKLLFSNFVSGTLKAGDIKITGNSPMGDFRALF
jgi:hypothetical protein